MADSLSADLRVYSDLGHLSRKAAEEVVRLANAAVARNGRCSLALAGGRTPRTLYELFAREYVEKRMSVIQAGVRARSGVNTVGAQVGADAA